MEAMASVRSSTTNNSDIIPNPSSVTSSTNSVPNNPHRTANPVVQFSGTVESFNNYEFLQQPRIGLANFQGRQTDCV